MSGRSHDKREFDMGSPNIREVDFKSQIYDN